MGPKLWNSVTPEIKQIVYRFKKNLSSCGPLSRNVINSSNFNSIIWIKFNKNCILELHVRITYSSGFIQTNSK